MKWKGNDIGRLHGAGLDALAAEAQIEKLGRSAPKASLVRACVVGDGISECAPSDELTKRCLTAAAGGRLSAFVPASGAATRLFRGFENPDAMGDSALLDRLLALWGVSPETMSSKAKGLLPIHGYKEGSRSCFEEHLYEMAQLTGGATPVGMHFTVSEAHEGAFGALWEAQKPVLRERTGVDFKVGFSVQDPSTDTVALDENGGIFRKDDGEILLRPGGHGALLVNLAQLNGDVVLIKNIDNVVCDAYRDEVVKWRQALVGHLLAIEAKVHQWLDVLALGKLENVDEVMGFCMSTFGLEGSGTLSPEEWVWDRLHRPLRVCGMVRASGHVGGGPFFVRNGKGEVSPQIVESVELDGTDPNQVAIQSEGTHFNPVELVCSLRNHRGEAYSLTQFVDSEAYLVTDKNHEGRALRALEHPGLWNGSMAGWNTVFVEIPASTFQPIKTLMDLLSPAHLGT